MHFPYYRDVRLLCNVHVQLLGLTHIIVNTPMMVMMQKMIDDDYKGRVFSILETMAMALMPLGMVIYGFLYDILLRNGFCSFQVYC